MKKRIQQVFSPFRKAFKEIASFCDFLFYYLKKKVIIFSVNFEKNKNRLVRFFLMKRGRYNRPFLHLATMGVIGVGVLIAPFLADTYPIFAKESQDLTLSAYAQEEQSVLAGQEDIFQTEISAKPRDKVIDYVVQKGDTVSTIARKFGVSENTIRWENNLSGDKLGIGEDIRVLPVSGIAHKVVSGETVQSVAKKYDTEPQKIVDFPFNDFAGGGETFALVTGQMLIVPDGIKPSEQPFIKREVYIAQGPVPVATGGYTFPIRGPVSQGYAWYHPGLDILSPIGTPIVAAHSGTVTSVSIGTYDGGYGNNVRISNGNGTTSLYAHMSTINVRVGQQVTGGSSVLGAIGMTGRTTGPHVHFEMQIGGSYVNPLGYVQ